VWFRKLKFDAQSCIFIKFLCRMWSLARKIWYGKIKIWVASFVQKSHKVETENKFLSHVVECMKSLIQKIKILSHVVCAKVVQSRNRKQFYVAHVIACAKRLMKKIKIRVKSFARKSYNVEPENKFWCYMWSLTWKLWYRKLKFESHHLRKSRTKSKQKTNYCVTCDRLHE
jgi:hypothetical protein